MNGLKKNLWISLCAITILLSACESKITKLQKEIPTQATDTWLMSSMDSIGNFEETTPSNRITLNMAKGEYEHFQLVILPQHDKELNITRYNEDTTISFESRLIKDFEGVADVLVPTSYTIEGDSLIKMWLTYHTAPNTPAGKYEEVIEFAGDSSRCLIGITINVYDCVIPSVSSIPAVFGINPEKMRIDSLPFETQILKKKEMSDLLLSYRISPYFSTWINNTMKVENTSSPYPWQDPRTLSYIQDERFTAIAAPYHSLSETELKEMLQEMEQNGLTSKLYFYVWDEPTLLKEYAEIHKYADRIHRYSPNARVITTFFRGPKDGDRIDDLFATFELLRGATDIYCTGVWSLRTSESRSDSCRQALRGKEEWWNYVCMSDVPGLAYSSQYIQNRATMWRSYKEQSSGFLYWVVNSFDSINPLQSRKNLPAGDGVLVYPGEAFGLDSPIVSMRLERWRDGAEDYELLKLLEHKSGREVALLQLAQVYTSPLQQTQSAAAVDEFKKNLLINITKK